jgi:hypothetical protein
MKQFRKIKLLSAAIAAVSLMGVPAFGQLRAGTDGHANDGGNRVGSGGYNAAGTVYTNGFNSNNIVNNNVTGLFGIMSNFEHDPRSFMGYSASDIADNFIRQSSGAPTAYQTPTLGNTPTAFYGAGRDVAPPVGTERIGYTQSYIGTPFTPTNPYSLGSNITSALDIQRQQYGESAVIGAGSNLVNNNNSGSQSEQSSPLDANTYTGSPLYGLNGLSNDATDYGLPVFATSSSSSTGNRGFKFRSSTEIDRAQRELLQQQQQSLDADQTLNGVNAGSDQQNGNVPSPNRINTSGRLNAVESPNSQRLTSRQDNPALNGTNINGDLNMQQSVQQRPTLMTPQQQSSQYNILSQRLAQATNPQVQSLQENARLINEINRNRTKGTSGHTDTGGATTRPSVPGIGAGAAMMTPGADLEPLKVKSLADGITAHGLHDLLQNAESLMRQGKFESAIQKYNTAARIAPNNGLIPLGRANAELGAGYYYQASADLHQVFQADPALLMGQYDLKNWISAKRLQFITDELGGLAKSDTKQETPSFLLAYIAYNTGRESQAEGYLKDARTRAGGHDPLLGQLQTRWKLSGSSSTLQGNK